MSIIDNTVDNSASLLTKKQRAAIYHKEQRAAKVGCYVNLKAIRADGSRANVGNLGITIDKDSEIYPVLVQHWEAHTIKLDAWRAAGSVGDQPRFALMDYFDLTIGFPKANTDAPKKATAFAWDNIPTPASTPVEEQESVQESVQEQAPA